MDNKTIAGGKMNDTQLDRAIRSIGKGCFVMYYDQFRDFTKSNENLVEMLMKNEGYTEKASLTRVAKSRQIIKAGRAKDVLIEISKSDKLDNYIKTKAREILSR